MTLKKIKFFDFFLIIFFSFLTHTIYMWMPNTLFSIFLPVNESVFEHMKMLYTSILIVTLFDYFAFKHWNIKNRNFLASAFISSSLSIPLFLSLNFLSTNIFGSYKLLQIVILFLVVFLSQVISFFILKQKYLKYTGYIGIVGIIIIYIIFAYFTYYPLENDFFRDFDRYGINHFILNPPLFNLSFLF